MFPFYLLFVYFFDFFYEPVADPNHSPHQGEKKDKTDTRFGFPRNAGNDAHNRGQCSDVKSYVHVYNYTTLQELVNLPLNPLF